MVVEQDISALQGFIDETTESLQGIESAFIQLENDPANPDLINRIFRPVHSMKGNSGFFGLTNINKFAHRLEDLLDYIRKGEVSVDGEVIDILLTGIDFLQKMLERVSSEPNDVLLRPEEEAFLTEKVERCKPQVAVGSSQSVIAFEKLLLEAEEVGITRQDNALLRSALDQIEKWCADLGKLIKERRSAVPPAQLYDPGRSYRYKGEDYSSQVMKLATGGEQVLLGKPIKGELLREFAAAIHELQTALAGEEKFRQPLEELDSLRNFLDDPLLVANVEFNTTAGRWLAELIGAFESSKPATGLGDRLGDILVEQQVVTEAQLTAALEKQPRVGEILLKEGMIKHEDLEKALAIQGNRVLKQHLQESQALEQTKTIRIDQAKLDTFANAVGELFINIDSFHFLGKQFEAKKVGFGVMAKFNNTMTALSNMVSRLQEHVMSVRKVPVKTLFQRFPRVVRQLAGTLGKEIVFVVEGEETVIDKDLLEQIENPLVHILRNSIDHGIEMPAERVAQEKNPQGRLRIAASVDELYVTLVIEDDGAGINPQTMKRVAVEKQFLSAAEAERLSDRELVNLIFKPGFSSAAKVSDVSGRGVGMDVVKNFMTKSNGTIDVASVVGQGTTVTIKIPLTRTLVTKDALIVEAGGQFFAIFSEDISTTIYPKKELLELLESERGISYNGAILRVVDMNNFFYGQPRAEVVPGSDQVLVICARYQLALLVDRMFNHQQIVVKLFTGSYSPLQHIPGVYGYTILGNEDIVLIANVQDVLSELGGG